MKRLITTIASGLLFVFAVGCGGSGAKGACEHVNEICASEEGFQASDCTAAETAYDALTDDQKKAADTQLDCVNAASTCADLISCG